MTGFVLEDGGLQRDHEVVSLYLVEDQLSNEYENAEETADVTE